MATPSYAVVKIAFACMALMAAASAPTACSAAEGIDLVDVANQFVAATEPGPQDAAPGDPAPLHGRKLLTFFCGSRLCPFGQLCCNRVCTDVLSDPNNCLLCGKKCAAGLPCQKGLCGYGFFGIPSKK